MRAFTQTGSQSGHYTKICNIPTISLGIVVAIIAFLAGRHFSPSEYEVRSASFATSVSLCSLNSVSNPKMGRLAEVSSITANPNHGPFAVTQRSVTSGYSEYDHFLELATFLDSRKDENVLKKSDSRFRLASLHRTIDDDSEAFFLKLDESSQRVGSARDRFEANSSLESEAMLACWLLLHGEMLALPPANRANSSLVALHEGKDRLGHVQGVLLERDPDRKAQKIDQFEKESPAAALLLQTIAAREAVIFAAIDKNTKILIDENQKKTILVGQYRHLVGKLLQADSAYHLGSWGTAETAFNEAEGLSRRLEHDVINHEPEGRRPFLFVAEPFADEPNTDPLQFIDESQLAKVIPTLSSLAHLRFLERNKSESAREKLTTLDLIVERINDAELAAEDNALGFLVRGFAEEYRAILTLEQVLGAPDHAKPATAKYFEKARASATQDLKEAKELIGRQADHPVIEDDLLAGSFNTAFVSIDSNEAINEALAVAAENDDVANPITTLIDETVDRLESTVQFRKDIYQQLARGESSSAWQAARQLLLRHGTDSSAWSDYIRTGIRSRQDGKQLQAELELARAFGVFNGAPERDAELAARVELYLGRAILSEKSEFVRAVLFSDTDKLREEEDRLTLAAESFAKVVRRCDEAIARIPEDDKHRVHLLTLRAHAGALRSLLHKDLDPRLTAGYARDANFALEGIRAQLQSSRATQRTLLDGIERADDFEELSRQVSLLAERTDLVESFAAAQQAKGLLLVIADDPRQLDIALSYIAASETVAGDFRGAGGLGVDNSLLLLNAILLRDSGDVDYQDEHQMRRGMQLLVEGLVLGDLGDPVSAHDRVKLASTILQRDAVGEELPISLSHVWSLLMEGEDEVDPLTAAKMARLTALLVRLESSASPYSRNVGDIAKPTHVDADSILMSALAMSGSETSTPTIDTAKLALSKTARPVESIAAALAFEAKARALAFESPRERIEWLDLTRDAIVRSDDLQVAPPAEFNRKFPLLVQVRQTLERRLTSSEYFLLRARLAASRFRFDEAEARLRDGIAHHPYHSEMWSELAALLYMRLEVDDFSDLRLGTSRESVLAALDEVSLAWEQHRPSDRWQRELLQARYLASNQEFDAALLAVEKAAAAAPNDERSKALIQAKRGEILASKHLTNILP